LVAGIVEGFSGWRSTFIVSGIGPLLALAVIPLLPPVLADSHAAAPRLDFRPIFCNRPLMAYVVALAGNTWEVFAVRVWFVAYLTWILRLPGNRLALPGPAVISGLASLVGFPVNIAVAELALRYGRSMVITTCVISVLVCVALASTAGVALDWFGGAGRPEAWSAAFAAIALGSAVAACAMAAARPRHDRA
jgi:hypothetical protein